MTKRRLYPSPINQPRVSDPSRLATTDLDEGVKRELVERLMTPDQPKPQGEPAIRSLWPGTLIVSDAPSGATYQWDGAGSEVTVASEDVEFVMSRNRGGKERACCGSGGRRTYFEFA